MSLIITSSAKQDETTQLGISIPYQYKNHIKNPLTIPANSEVAVESVKIQRVPMLDFGNNIRANFWFGERLASNASYEEQTSYFIPVENTILGSKSPEDFADEFKVVLQQAYSYHPEIDSVNISVSVHTVLGIFEGFHYRIPQIAADATRLTALSSATYVQEISSAETTWSGTTLTADNNDCFAQLLPQSASGGPISLHNGSLSFNASEGTVGVFGLSRAYCTNPITNEIQGWEGNSMAKSGPTNDHPFGGALQGKGRGEYGDVFMDYCVENNGTDIRIYNYRGSTSGRGIGRMREVQYYNKNNGALNINNGSNSSFATGSPLLSSQMGPITFTITNELVKISISGTDAMVSSVSFESASYKDQICMPTSISNWKMYPTMYLPTTDDKVTIDSYSPRTSTTIYNNFPENSWIARTKIPVFLNGRGRDVTQSQAVADGFSGRYEEPWNNAWSWDQQIYSRQILTGLTSFAQSQVIKNYKGLSNNNMEDYENIFIMGRNDRYIDSRVQTWQANSARTLGFSPFSINQVGGIIHGGGQHGASFVSAGRPKLSSEQSTFIRIPTLTHETYNFNTGNPSKILFQLPRFDNSGAETGALYFQNNDKTFVDLKNSYPLQITDIDVHLVRKDETFAKDLTGSTEVLLFIREKK